MTPHPPSAFYAVVFRGGDVTFLPRAEALQLMEHKARGETTVALQTPEPWLVDLAAVERVQPFMEWKEAYGTKLAASGRRVCVFGSIHDADSHCDCYDRRRVPLTVKAANVLLEEARETSASAMQYPVVLETGGGQRVSKAIEDGYIQKIANAHGMQIPLLPLPVR